MHLRSLLLLIVVAVLLAAAACSDPDSSAEGLTGSTTSTPATPTTTAAPLPTTSTSTPMVADTTTTAPAPKPIAVIADDYRFEGIPDATQTGTRLTLFNNSSTEFHEMVIFKLNPDEQRTVDELSKLPLDEINQASVGTLQSIVFAMPDSEQYTYGAGPPVLAEEGRYLVFCAINVGSDPIEARNDSARGPAPAIDGVPRHYQVGMMTEVNVSG